jgi:predicted nucleic acid-binding protein
MSTLVLLDTGPLGMVTNPQATAQTERCNRWMEGLLARGVRVLIPEIADYELRRELLRAEKVAGLRRLDALVEALEYLPITTAVMRQAAAFWAEARCQGRPTADDKALDGDVILAAQAGLAKTDDDVAIVATGNVGHLSRFVPAYVWWEIS